jgi:hypothetical protein
LLERILLEDHSADTYIQAIQSTLPELVGRDPLLARVCLMYQLKVIWVAVLIKTMHQPISM